MDILKSSQLVIFSHSTIFITFSYRSLAGFLFKLLQSSRRRKPESGVGFLRLTAVCPRSGKYLTHAHSHITRAVAAMDSCFGLDRRREHGIAVRQK